MRADRLLSVLLLLQTRGRMTARGLARELEVSERTIYRDIDALSVAGVPVYGQAGPAGGYSLVDSYRTTLTGLTKDEVGALSMLSVPAPLADLGLSDNLRSALLKLSAALPHTQRENELRVRQRFFLDSTWWHRSRTSRGVAPVPHLQAVHQAVWNDRKLCLSRLTVTGSEVEQTVDPYGLVAKGGDWYVVYVWKERVRALRVADLLAVKMADEPFARPAEFDLGVFWRAWCAEYEETGFLYPVRVRVDSNMVRFLPMLLGDRIRDCLDQTGAPDAEGWIALDLEFESLEEARYRLLGLGRAVEILGPLALRRSVQDFAEQIVALYGVHDRSGSEKRGSERKPDESSQSP